MRLHRRWMIVFLFSFISILLGVSAAQDVRTLSTKVVDILAQFPSENSNQTEQLCQKILRLGPEGILKMCTLLVPPGTGDDTQVRYALNGLAHHVCRPGAEDKRIMVSEVLAQALASALNTDVRIFLISQLQLVGQDESVKVLAPYLKDDLLCDPAVRVLLTIGTNRAEKAVLRAFGSASKKTLPILIKALGEMQSEAAVKKLIPIAIAQNIPLRSLARYALANIGDPKAGEVLSRVAVISTPEERQQAPALLLLYSRRLKERGHTPDCVNLCRDLIRTRTAPYEDQIPCSALSLLVSTLGERSLDDILAAMDSGNDALVGKALDLISEIPGKHVTQECIRKLDKAPDKIRAGILRMLGQRGDDLALPVCIQSIQDTVSIVRHVAVEASARMSRNDVIPYLLKVLQESRTEDIPVVKEVLLAFTDQKAVPSLAEAIPGMPPQSRIPLLEILAERRASAYLEIVFTETEADDGNVRFAAMKALEPLVSEKELARCIDLLLKVSDDSEIGAVRNAVVAAAYCVADPEERIGRILPELMKQKGGQRARLIGVLPEIGGKAALQTVVTETRHSNPVVRDAAIRALSEWTDFDAADYLLPIAQKAGKAEHRRCALTGYIRLVKDASITSGRKLSMLQNAMDAAEGAEEKRAVLTVLSRIRTIESLLYTGTFLDDSTLQNNAALAAAAIACPDQAFEKGIVDPACIPVLKKAMDVVEDPYVRKQIENHLDTLSKSGPFSDKDLNQPPEGFTALFNGKDLAGWKGLAGEGGSPLARMKMSDGEFAEAQKEADALMSAHWKAEKGILVFDGKGSHLCTAKDYGDFEMFVDWKIGPGGDSGIYLRGSPQVQIWDPAQWPEGSGGLYNNQKNPSKPVQRADNPVGEWNTFRIIMIGERVTVYLNSVLVVDNVIMENYWDRTVPIFPLGQIELQSHGSPLYFRNIFIREIPREGAWRSLFNGRDFTGWMGATDSYFIEEEKIISPRKGGGNLYTEEQFDNFIFQFEFKLDPGANNGLGIRTPSEGDAAYVGMELQILDDTAHIYKDLQPYQYHGSIYGVVPAKRGHLKPVGEWNYEEVIARGSRITVNLNGVTIVNADIIEASSPQTIDGNDHPGLRREKGHICFCGHNSRVEFRNIRIKKLK
jgi:HEAT repeat protein